jgi:hypothetical protein
MKLVLLWAQLTKIYPPLPISVQPISLTKTLRIVPTKNERDLRKKIAQLAIKNSSNPVSLNYRLSVCIMIVFLLPTFSSRPGDILVAMGDR